MNEINEIIQKYWEGKVPSDAAAVMLAERIQPIMLADFIMDAFARGWITPFNLGLQEK